MVFKHLAVHAANAHLRDAEYQIAGGQSPSRQTADPSGDRAAWRIQALSSAHVVLENSGMNSYVGKVLFTGRSRRFIRDTMFARNG